MIEFNIPNRGEFRKWLEQNSYVIRNEYPAGIQFFTSDDDWTDIGFGDAIDTESRILHFTNGRALQL